MRAVLLPGDGSAEVVEREVPTPGPHDVLVRTRASAICASDLSLYRGSALVGGDAAGKGQIIPGHEPAGDVVQVGDAVRRVTVGDRVAVHLSIGCMRCEYCRAGYIEQCAEWKCLGFDLDGGDADYLIAPEVNCLALPDEMSYEAGALIVDNFGTQYHTQKRLGVSGVGTTAVIGIGPMGAAGILTAKARGARVIAVDVLDHRLELAERLGADHLVNSSGDGALAEILALTRGRGVENAIDCSGKAAGETLALEAAAKLGKVAFVGEGPELTVSPSEQFIRKELEVIGAWVWPIYEFDEIVRFLLDHNVDIESTVSDRRDLGEAADAFSRVERRLSEKVMFVWE
jgi:threonine dehydrogenase-like Zn-dependent dehydrogenase